MPSKNIDTLEWSLYVQRLPEIDCWTKHVIAGCAKCARAVGALTHGCDEGRRLFAVQKEQRDLLDIECAILAEGL